MKKLTAEDEKGFRKALNEQTKAGTPTRIPIQKPGVHAIKCPSCKQNIELTDKDLKFHKHGRRAECPLCHKGIVMRKFVKRAP